MSSPYTPDATEERWDCALIQDALPLYLEGELSPTSQSIIAEHLSGCPRCAAYLAGVHSVRSQLRNQPPHTTQAPHAPHPTAPAPATRSLFLLVAVAAIVFVASVVGGFGSAMIWFGFTQYNAPQAFFGLVAAIACFTILSVTATRLGPMPLARWLLLGMSCLIGSMGAIAVAESPLLGMLLALIGLAGAWMSVWQPGLTRMGGNPSTRTL